MKKHRGIFLLAFDVVVVVGAYVFALIIRYDFGYSKAIRHEGFTEMIPIIIVVYLVVFVITRTHRTVWEKISVEEGFKIIIANSIGAFTLVLITANNDKHSIPLSVIVIAFLLNTLVQESVRFSYRIYRFSRIRKNRKKQKHFKRVLIYGAGNSGAFIANEIVSNNFYDNYVVGFIDDNPLLKGSYVSGHVVFGGQTVLEKVINQHVIDEIIIAMPNQSQKEQNEIKSIVFKLGVPMRSIASSKVLVEGMNLKQTLRRVDLLDLLQRKEIIINDSKVRTSIEGKTILVTGGAGSIGSEIVRQILSFNPTKIVIIDLNENALYSLQQELNMVLNEYYGNSKTSIDFFIASIRDEHRIDKIFNRFKFDMVFHAAAHKHVPLMETSPKEAIKNNILGTRNLIDMSKKYNVDKFVNISTDKAVNPTNVMGATKRFSEMMLQSENGDSSTKFMAVRFGNVLGSNGSVVPFFTKQIEAGGPVTVTHPDITRYFMTIPEAVSLVLQAETYAKGGEIFVLNMGEPVKIVDLAKQMITLSGFIPNKDIMIEYVGLRPGEKLYEELLMDEEGMSETDNELIYIAKPIITPQDEIKAHITKLKEVCKSTLSNDEVKQVLMGIVPTYKQTEII